MRAEIRNPQPGTKNYNASDVGRETISCTVGREREEDSERPSQRRGRPVLKARPSDTISDRGSRSLRGVKAKSKHERSRSKSSKRAKAGLKTKVASDPFDYLPRFETKTQGEDCHEEDIRTLSNGDQQERRLARELFHWDAGPEHDSLACPLCNRDRRLQQIPELCQAVHKHVPKRWTTLVHSVTVISPELKVDPDDLDLLLDRVSKASEKISKRLRRNIAEDVVAAIGFDLSWNEDSADRWEPHWQGHFHCVVAGVDKAAVWKVLQSLSEPTESVSHPVEVHTLRKVRRLPKIVSYTVKGRPYRRACWIDDEGNSHSKPYSLKPHQLRQALQFLHKLGPGKQLRLVGIDRPRGRLSK